MTLRSASAIAAFLALTNISALACSCARMGPGVCGHLNKSDLIFVGTVIAVENPATERDDDQGGASRYTFHVDEVISGTKRATLDVFSGRGGGDCSYHFEKGEQYLVFPSHGQKGQLWAAICSSTTPIAQGRALLSRLRAERDGKKVPSLFGSLYETQEPYPGTVNGEFDPPVAGAKIRLQRDDQLFETTTDSDGGYAFYDLAAGTYQLSAALPENLEIGEPILDNPAPSLKLPEHACYERDLNAMPKGSLRGQVIGPDGKPLRYARVDLFPADKYAEGKFGWGASQGRTDYFEFKHVPPGEYMLVFNNENEIDEDTPFPRFYYPNVTDAAQARHLQFHAGEVLQDMNIYVAGPSLTRFVTIKLIAEGGALPDINYVEATGHDGSSLHNYDVAPGTIQIPVFRGKRYSVHGEGSCTLNNTDSKTPTVEIDGSDESTSEITLAFPKPCHK